jgi:hypothetical protein
MKKLAFGDVFVWVMCVAENLLDVMSEFCTLIGHVMIWIRKFTMQNGCTFMAGVVSKRWHDIVIMYSDGTEIQYIDW